MGGLIAAVFTAVAVLAALLLRQRDLDPVLASGVRLGLASCLGGMVEAALMFANTTYSDAGAYTVGAADGRPGLRAPAGQCAISPLLGAIARFA